MTARLQLREVGLGAGDQGGDKNPRHDAPPDAIESAFGVARGILIVITGTVAGVFHSRRTRAWVRWAERVGGALMLGAAFYFLYRASVYAGWLSP